MVWGLHWFKESGHALEFGCFGIPCELKIYGYMIYDHYFMYFQFLHVLFEQQINCIEVKHAFANSGIVWYHSTYIGTKLWYMIDGTLTNK